MSQDMIKAEEYRDLIARLKKCIQAAQFKAALAVNTQLIALYWDIGQQIADRQQVSGWDGAMIEQINKDSSHEFQNMKGFSRANFYRMKRFYTFIPSALEWEKVCQKPWNKFCVGMTLSLFNKIMMETKTLETLNG